MPDFVQEVPGSILSQVTGYPDWVISRSSSVFSS